MFNPYWSSGPGKAVLFKATLLAVSLALLLAACSSATPTPTASPAANASATNRPDTPSATVKPTDTASPPASATSSPAPSVTSLPTETATSLLTSEPEPQTTDTPRTAYEPIMGLQDFATGFVAPLVLVPAGDETGRLLVADQTGLIWILQADGEKIAEPFLDLRDHMVRLNTSYDERGLLGLALHPNFAANGRLFVYYSAPLRAGAPAGWDHTSHISEFQVSPDAYRAAPDSERVLLQIDQPQSNHNGGQISFGPDGYLYIPLGDGGGANDVGSGHPPLGNGQDTSTLMGSILRIDVDGAAPYTIPDDNPFNGQDGRAEIYAYGFRNPFRIAFDAGGQHQLFVGDAGQNLWEEVDIVTTGGNYGWNIKEGSRCFDPQNPNRSPVECATRGPDGQPLLDPIIEYQNGNAPGGLGLVVIGGFVYRGTALPGFQDRYIFGDWSTSFGKPDGTLLVATPPQTGERWSIEELEISTSESGRIDAFLLSFGQDAQHELYVLTSETTGPSGDTGKIFKLVPGTTLTPVG